MGKDRGKSGSALFMWADYWRRSASGSPWGLRRKDSCFSGRLWITALQTLLPQPNVLGRCYDVEQVIQSVDRIIES